MSAAVQAQRFGSVVFGKLPQDYQLYPRNAKNEAPVPIAGIVESAGWKYISVVVKRKGDPYQYRKANIQYAGNGKGTFSTEATVKAELAGYDFGVYVCKDNDSVLVATRKNVVSGDVYIVSGQSNSTGFFGEADTNTFCRTFGKITGNLNTEHYNPADTLWTLSNKKAYDNGVGSMGFEIQKQLMEKSGIPNCLINAGFHWSSASQHATRTEGNPADLTNGYGRMLYRVQKAGLKDAVKAYIFRQGETEAYHEGGDWEGNFDRLRKNLKMDLPGISKIYVFQIDIIYYASPVGAMVRDYQRRLPDIYPDLASLATVGTTGFDGLHYSREGNKQGGAELSRLILRDFYAATETSNIDSPNIRKVFYKTPEKKQLVLVFDEGQEIKYPDPYRHKSGVTLDMKDFFYLNGSAGAVTSGKAEGNRVTLDLKAAGNASTLSYLPLYVPENGPFFPFLGPYLTNRTGMRAFTFLNVPISTALQTTVLTAALQGNSGIKLSWEPIPGAEAYVLEQRAGENGPFTTIAQLQNNVLEFTVPGEPQASKLFYRIKAISKDSESSEYAQATVDAPLVLGAENPLNSFSVFPNPAVSGQPVTITFRQHENGTMNLVHSNGQNLHSYPVNQAKQLSITLPASAAGMHVLQFKSKGKSFSKKLLVR